MLSVLNEHEHLQKFFDDDVKVDCNKDEIIETLYKNYSPRILNGIRAKGQWLLLTCLETFEGIMQCSGKHDRRDPSVTTASPAR